MSDDWIIDSEYSESDIAFMESDFGKELLKDLPDGPANPSAETLEFMEKLWQEVRKTIKPMNLTKESQNNRFNQPP